MLRLGNFSFNGKTSPYVNYMDYKTHYGLERDVQYSEVVGRAGGVLSRVKENVRVIETNLIIDAYDTGRKLEDVADDIVSWLSTNEPAPLIFEREPDKVYYAILNESLDPTYFVSFSKVSVKFLCIDPFKYSRDESKNPIIEDSVTLATNGNAEYKPRLELTALKDTPYLAIGTSNNDFLAFGDPFVPNQSTTSKNPRILLDPMNTLSGWQHQTTGEILANNWTGGKVSGSMTTNSNYTAFRAKDYGAETGWRGPLVKKSLTKTVADFKITCSLKIFDIDEGIGKGFYHFYDEAGKVVCALGLVDDEKDGRAVKAVIQVFNDYGEAKTLLNYRGDNGTAYKNLEIYIQLERFNNKFTIKTWNYYIDKNGKRQQRSRLKEDIRQVFTDNGRVYQRPIRQVSAYIASHSSFPTSVVYMTRIEVLELIAQQGTDYFIKKGDNVIVDFEDQVITVNDEIRNDKKDFFSSYFDIKNNPQELVVLPNNTFSGYAIWRDKWQ